MPPKREFCKKLKSGEEFEPYYQEDYPKLVVVDLYNSWAGSCETLKEFYKYLNNSPQFEDYQCCEMLFILIYFFEFIKLTVVEDFFELNSLFNSC